MGKQTGYLLVLQQFATARYGPGPVSSMIFLLEMLICIEYPSNYGFRMVGTTWLEIEHLQFLVSGIYVCVPMCLIYHIDIPILPIYHNIPLDMHIYIYTPIVIMGI